MIINKRLFLFVILTIIVQVITINNFNAIYTSFPFLDGVPITSSYALENQYFIYWYLPIVGMSFYFSGYLSDELQTYGKILFTRNYSRKKWVIKRYLSLIIVLSLFIIVQLISFNFLLEDTSFIILSQEKIIILLVMYFLTLLTLFSIQLLLELYMTPQLSQLVINAYIVVSVLITKQLFTIGAPKFIYYFFLPNYGMGFKTNSSNIPQFQNEVVNYTIGFLILLILLASVLLFTIAKVKKMDIL